MALPGTVIRRPTPSRRPALTCAAILVAAGFMVLAVDRPAVSAVPPEGTAYGAAPPVRAAQPATDDPSAPPTGSGPAPATDAPPTAPGPTAGPTGHPTVEPSPQPAGPPPPPPPDPSPVDPAPTEPAPAPPAAAGPAAPPVAPAAPVSATPSAEIRPAGVVGPDRAPAPGSEPRFDAPAAGGPAADNLPAEPGHLVGTGWTSLVSGREAGFRIFIAGLIALVIAISGLVTVAVRRRPY